VTRDQLIAGHAAVSGGIESKAIVWHSTTLLTRGKAPFYRDSADTAEAMNRDPELVPGRFSYLIMMGTTLSK